MKIYSLSLIALLIAAFTACSVNRVTPSSKFISYTVPADNVNSIDISASIKVLFAQSEKVSVKVECPDNVADFLIVDVQKGRLVAGFKANTSFDGNSGVTITVSAPSLSRIDASSASRFEMSGSLVQDGDLDIIASSSATVSLYKLSIHDLEIDNSLSSTVEIGGVTANNIGIECSSAAHTSINEIRCLSIDADASSAAAISLAGIVRSAEFDASSAASIKAGSLKAETIKSAQASSGAAITCRANTVSRISESSGGSVNIDK